MWRGTASILCVAALPLLGCAGNYSADEAQAVAQAPLRYYAPPPQVHTAGPAAPAAVLVILPGAGFAASEPGLWTAQGFDVVMPEPADISRLVADEQVAIARLVASATANAPVWLIGPDQIIEVALGAVAERGRGIEGVVVTSGASPVFSCSESFSYFDPGTGAPPQVQVRRSANCGSALQPGIGTHQPAVVQPPASPHSTRPRIIEASAASKDLPPAARVKELAQLIKSVPPG